MDIRAAQQNSERAPEDLEPKKDHNTCVEPGSPITGRNRKNIV
jgi:hypothetical protein